MGSNRLGKVGLVLLVAGAVLGASAAAYLWKVLALGLEDFSPVLPLVAALLLSVVIVVVACAFLLASASGRMALIAWGAAAMAALLTSLAANAWGGHLATGSACEAAAASTTVEAHTFRRAKCP